MYYYSKGCLCKDIDTKCTRNEFYGVQLNHFAFFIILGFLFPSYFYIIQLLGILFELFEYYLDKNNDFVIKYINGWSNGDDNIFIKSQEEIFKTSSEIIGLLT